MSCKRGQARAYQPGGYLALIWPTPVRRRQVILSVWVIRACSIGFRRLRDEPAPKGLSFQPVPGYAV